MPSPSKDQFISEGVYAERLGLSRGAVVAAIQRGEVPGVVRVGRSVRVFWPAVILAGLDTDALELAKKLGVKDLESLTGFLTQDSAR